MKGDDLADRLVEFAVRVIAVVDSLPKSSAGKHIGGQLLRCGTFAFFNLQFPFKRRSRRAATS